MSKDKKGWRERIDHARFMAYMPSLLREYKRDPLDMQIRDHHTKRNLAEVFRIRDHLFRGQQ